MAAEYDFIVVGSGAGGGPLACRLALDPAGYRVALVEAGTDPAVLRLDTEDLTHDRDWEIPQELAEVALHARCASSSPLGVTSSAYCILCSSRL